MRMFRYWIGRAMVHAGLRFMPPGRVREELSELLWTWRMKVDATVAATRASNGNRAEGE